MQDEIDAAGTAAVAAQEQVDRAADALVAQARTAKRSRSALDDLVLALRAALPAVVEVTAQVRDLPAPPPSDGETTTGTPQRPSSDGISSGESGQQGAGTGA